MALSIDAPEVAARTASKAGLHFPLLSDPQAPPCLSACCSVPSNGAGSSFSFSPPSRATASLPSRAYPPAPVPLSPITQFREPPYVDGGICATASKHAKHEQSSWLAGRRLVSRPRRQVPDHTP